MSGGEIISWLEPAAWVLGLAALAALFTYSSDDDAHRFWRSAGVEPGDDRAQSTKARSST